MATMQDSVALTMEEYKRLTALKLEFRKKNVDENKYIKAVDDAIAAYLAEIDSGFAKLLITKIITMYRYIFIIFITLYIQ